MKKIIFTIIIALVLFGACKTGDVKESSEKYTDARDVMEQTLVVISDFIDSIEKSEEAEGIADAINKFTESITELAPVLKEIDEKYPELDNISSEDADVPEILQDVIAKMDPLMETFMESIMKVQTFLTDPKVVEAFGKMNEAMK